jgi:DNA-binding LacI/PurR family transcriptional regulator
MTVSRVLNGATGVSPQRVQAVQDAIASTGFLVSASARQLATGTADAYAVVLTEPLDELLTDPTFATQLTGITDGLASTPVMPILFTMATPEERAKGLRLLKRGTVDAVIHLSPYVDDGLLEELVQAGVPVVLCGQPEDRFDDLRHADEARPAEPTGDGSVEDGATTPAFATMSLASVYTDDVAGATLAARHLLDRGARRVAAIMGPADNPATTDRLQGLVTTLGDRLVTTSYARWDVDSGRQAAEELIASGSIFDAVACGNDRIAIGVIQALHLAGRRVPDDVRVIGFDDHPFATMSQPPLTTILQPFHDQGEIAVTLAAEMVRGASPRTVVLDPILVVRQST